MKKAANIKAGVTLAAVLLCMTCRPAYAGSPGESEDAADRPGLYTAVDGSQIEQERLADQVIEYEELGSLIHYNNLSIREMTKSSENTRQDYKEIRDFLKSERASASRNKDKAKDESDTERYVEYASLAEIYRSSAAGYNDMIEKLDGYSSNKSRFSLEKQLTNAAQSLMISWQSLKLQKEYLKAMGDLYRTQYENAQIKQSAGLTTEQEVSAAYDLWRELSVSLDSLADSEAEITQSLFLILGIDGQEEMELQTIPSADPELILKLNLEQDTRKAIGNNTDLISARSDSSDSSTAGMRKKQRTTAELEEQVAAKMQQLYDQVLQAKQSYDAAKTGYEGAVIRWENAERQYDLGMFSQEEYLQEKIQYINKKTALETADLSLFQSLETYDWAVKGIVTLE